AVWGAEFAKLLEMQPELETYPFVSDLAKLDWLRHNSMRANDSVFDSGSLVLLTSAHLDELYIDFSESCYLMTSSFPVIEFWLAHQKTHDAGDDEELAKQYLTQALKKLAKTDFTQHICIYRTNLIAQLRELSDDEYLWLTHLMAGKSIGHALDDMPEGIFDFAQWLGQAIDLNLIKGIK
ncbi:hypothetical protein H5202_23370, partial [Shewanella sp. SG41-4]|uniref:hypothetical protein n=1 Tax=Shewanella sp. SG41-4 TaxID=2760976 RepID=UPI001601837C